MSITIPSAITIDAPREDVWAVLTDFPYYGAWSNFTRVDGVAQEGTKLSMRMPGMIFKATVTVATEHSQLQWSANIGRNEIFLGQHTFTLESTVDGKTVLTNSELFSGILVKPFGRLFANANRNSGYDVFNRALKARVETLAPQNFDAASASAVNS